MIYLRATYASSPTTCRLVMSKTRVAPLKTQTIPKLELCGAVLLAEILETTRTTLEIPVVNIHAWCDSTIVLCWLNHCPKRYKTFVANRITSATSLLPPSAWTHVPTLDNPADCASRGLSAREVKEHELWWNGPPWLLEEPIAIPKQPQASELAVLQSEELRPSACLVIASAPSEWLEHRFNSYRTLVHDTAWVKMFAHNYLSTIRGHASVRKKRLAIEDIHSAELFLQKASQARAFPAELAHLHPSPPKFIPSSSRLLSFHPCLGQDGLLRVERRLSKAPIPLNQKHPIILSSQDIFTCLLFKCNHVCLSHCGPTLLVSNVGETHHVMGARRLARTTCKRCITCRQAAAKVQNQLMGQLPESTSPPSSTTGIDYAGPFTLKLGHTRKPVLVKAYLAIFVCFSTKAVHIEAVSDLTTGAFLATVKSFILTSTEHHPLIPAEQQSQVAHHPREGTSLWRSLGGCCQHHLRRVVGQQRLSFEEFTTVAAQVEAYLKSRPLGTYSSHSPDGVVPLTPGHFLVGRALQAYPETKVEADIPLCKRWTLCQAIVQHFCRRWSREYLQQLQTTKKWHLTRPNLQVGDLVLMTDGNIFQTHCTMAKVTAVYPGDDNLVRAMDVQIETLIQPAPSTTKTVKASQLWTKTSIYRRPVSKLALLVPAGTNPVASKYTRL